LRTMPSDQIEVPEADTSGSNSLDLAPGGGGRSDGCSTGAGPSSMAWMILLMAGLLSFRRKTSEF